MKTEPESKRTKKFYEIGHFRVPKTLTFKMRLGAQSFSSLEMSFICMRMKNDFHIKRLSTYPGFDTETRGNSELASSPTFSQK